MCELDDVGLHKGAQPVVVGEGGGRSLQFLQLRVQLGVRQVRRRSQLRASLPN